jgi:hypothetical protein
MKILLFEKLQYIFTLLLVFNLNKYKYKLDIPDALLNYR